MQTGDSIEQAKVFKAQAVPQGLCANLVHALKSLANQQEDGDDLLQNIVKELGKESRKGLTDVLREFIKIDNERALEVGHLNRSLKFGSRQCRKGTVRESPDELTLRAEEEGTSKALLAASFCIFSQSTHWMC